MLIVHDLDAATGSGVDDLLHWLVWNIPGAARALPERVPQGPTLADGIAPDQRDGPNYRGPAAPASGRRITTCSSCMRSMRRSTCRPSARSPAQTRAAVLAAMAGHVRGKGVYTGTFKRP